MDNSDSCSIVASCQTTQSNLETIQAGGYMSKTSTQPLDIEITAENENLLNSDVDSNVIENRSINDQEPSEEQKESPILDLGTKLLKINMLFIFIGMIIACIAQPQLAIDIIQLLLAWMESHLELGSIVFVIFYIFCDILMLPSAMIFTFGAGFVYCHMLGLYEGIFIATFLSFFSECIGSVLAFLISRYILRNHFQRIILRFYPKFELIDIAVKRHGFKITFLFRLSPITPYSIFNYFMGLTSVTFKDYCLASFGILPSFFCCCLVGSMFHNLYDISAIDLVKNTTLMIFVICSAFMVIFGMFYAVISIHNELKKVEREIEIEGVVDTDTDNDINEVNDIKIVANNIQNLF